MRKSWAVLSIALVLGIGMVAGRGMTGRATGGEADADVGCGAEPESESTEAVTEQESALIMQGGGSGIPESARPCSAGCYATDQCCPTSYCCRNQGTVELLYCTTVCRCRSGQKQCKYSNGVYYTVGQTC
jgi:hypothetical protein